MLQLNYRKLLGSSSIFIMIINSGSILSKVEPFDKFFIFSSLAILLFSLFFLNKKIFNNNFFYYVMLFLFFSTSSFIVNFDFSSFFSYIYFNVNILLAYNIILLLKTDEIVDYYLSFMKYLAILSLFGFFFQDYLGFLKYNFEFRDQLYNYYWFYGGIDGVDFRNFSIFVEPGLFQIYLIFAIILMIFFKNEKSYKFYSILFIFFFCVFTTKSTSGYVLAALCFAALIIKSSKNIYLKFFSIPFSILSTYVFIYLFDIKSNLENKIYGDQQLSFLTRMKSTEADLTVFFSNPVTGVGFGNYISEIERNGYYIDAATNTYTQILAILGLPSLILLVSPIIIMLKRNYNQSLFIIIVVMFLLIVYYNQPFVLYPFLYFSIMAFYVIGNNYFRRNYE